MRRYTLLELSGMELHEVAHARRSFAGELAHGVRHAIVTPLPGQLGHGREMPDEVLGKPGLPKAFAPRVEGDVAISAVLQRVNARTYASDTGATPLHDGIGKGRGTGERSLSRSL